MPETMPRYTVELTTEGWQIKDNVNRRAGFLADVYGSRRVAAIQANSYNERNTAFGLGDIRLGAEGRR